MPPNKENLREIEINQPTKFTVKADESVIFTQYEDRIEASVSKEWLSEREEAVRKERADYILGLETTIKGQEMMLEATGLLSPDNNK